MLAQASKFARAVACSMSSPATLKFAAPAVGTRVVHSTAYDVGDSTNIKWHESTVTREHKEAIMGQKGCVLWFTGLSGSGKSTVACTLEHALNAKGHTTALLDGDNVRHGLNKNLSFSSEDRVENIRRIGEVSKLFADAGIITLVSFISPYQKDRDAVRERCVSVPFFFSSYWKIQSFEWFKSFKLS